MTVLSSEIKLFKPAEVSDLASNGGRLSAVQAVTNTANNVFPDVSEAERAAGEVNYRKLFAKVENPSEEALQNTLLYLEQITPGDDMITIFVGTQTDIQSDITADGETDSETHYGVGQLDSTVLAGVTSIDVLVEDAAAETIYRAGDTIRISDIPQLGGAGNEETRTIDSVSFVGNVATINFTGGLANGYSSADTYVSSGLPIGDIVAQFNSFVVTSAGDGAYDDTNLTLDSVGTVEDDWTLTFTDATNFDVVGANEGAVGSGTTGGNFAPNNPDHGAPYFTLGSAGWSGTFQAGDTITFSTVPAARSFWMKRNVPAGSTAIASNLQRTLIRGETV